MKHYEGSAPCPGCGRPGNQVAQYVGGRGILTPAGMKKYLHKVISDRMDIYKRANGFFTAAIGPKASSFDYYYSEAEAILKIVDAIPVAEPEKPQPEQ